MFENSYYFRMNGDGANVRKFTDKMQDNSICLYVCRFLNLDNAIRPTLTFFNIVKMLLNTDIFVHFATV